MYISAKMFLFLLFLFLGTQKKTCFARSSGCVVLGSKPRRNPGPEALEVPPLLGLKGTCHILSLLGNMAAIFSEKHKANGGVPFSFETALPLKGHAIALDYANHKDRVVHVRANARKKKQE